MSSLRNRQEQVKPSENGEQHPPDTSFEPRELETQSSPPPESAFDIFEPQSYKVPQSLAAAEGVKKHLVELPVRSPHGTWYVRRHPDEAYCRKSWFIILKEEDETYLVAPHLWAGLQGESAFKPLVLYLATTKQGKLFLWAVKVPVDETREPAKWMRAPLEAARLAKDTWTRISWDERTRQHNVNTNPADHTEPEWPDLPMRDLMELAFKGFTITDVNHPVLRRLRGEV
jgi:hypothetical protein